jgi:alkanesulfonate monooxygenase SsuD/methylene tetrahydromethanopterin reductase-like flavin-dependent oxidoreductase (luciferase family)
MKHGVWAMNYPAARTMSEVVEFAVAAEQAGWDGVFVSDSITDGTTDPWVTLGAIAARTERITLGTWISAPATYQPWRLALAAASLDQLSGGRLMLGVGLGVGADFDRFGDGSPPAVRARRYDEALEVIELLWSGEPVTFAGEFFRLDDVTLPIVPLQEPRIPTVVAGWWPNERPFRRAGRWDGTMPYWPALLGGELGPEGQQSDGTVDGELRDLMAFYRESAGDFGEVVLPRQERDDSEYRALANEVGATWLLTSYSMDLAELREGPPS